MSHTHPLTPSIRFGHGGTRVTNVQHGGRFEQELEHRLVEAAHLRSGS
jgi:hypothetical protein